MVEKIDCVATAIRKAGFDIDIDGDGSRVELIDWDQTVYIHLDNPRQTNWTNLWEGCRLEIFGTSETIGIEQDIRSRLQRAGITVN